MTHLTMKADFVIRRFQALIILLLAAIMLPESAIAQDGYTNYAIRAMSLRSFSMDVNQLYDYRDPYFDRYGSPQSEEEERWRGLIGTNFNLDLLTVGKTSLYMDNRVWTAGTNKQVRAVGWEWKTGIRYEKIEFYWYHHSQHIMEDVEGPYHFPLKNYAGFSYTFYKRPGK